MSKNDKLYFKKLFQCGFVALVSVFIVASMIFSVYFLGLSVKSKIRKDINKPKKEHTTSIYKDDKKRYKGGIYVPEATTEPTTVPDVVYETTTKEKATESSTVKEETTTKKNSDNKETTKRFYDWEDLFPTTSPTKPTKPEKPSEPEKPSKPEKPSEPEFSTELQEPITKAEISGKIVEPIMPEHN